MDRVTLARRIPARWSGTEVEGITIVMDIVFRDKRGLLRQVTDILYQAGLNIESLSTENLE